jgi:SAM-dependent methyltransferase
MGLTDVPSDHGFLDPVHVRRWLEETNSKFPERLTFLDAFVAETSALDQAPLSVVELGSGPGVLAEQLLSRCQIERYWLVDFSPHMHDLARERVGDDDRAIYVQADFQNPDWSRAVGGPVDVVVSMQAVHELRNASRTPDLYRQVSGIVRPGGVLLICDHLRPVEDHRPVFMTSDEHLEALREGGIREPHVVLSLERLALFKGWVASE